VLGFLPDLVRNRDENTIEPLGPVGLVAKPGDPAEGADRPENGVPRDGTDTQDPHGLQENLIRCPAWPLLRPVQPVMDDRGIAVLAPLREKDPKGAGNRGEVRLKADGDADVVAAVLGADVIAEDAHENLGAAVGKGEKRRAEVKSLMPVYGLLPREQRHVSVQYSGVIWSNRLLCVEPQRNEDLYDILFRPLQFLQVFAQFIVHRRSERSVHR